MYWKNKGKKFLSVLLATMLLVCLFPAVYAEDPDTDEPADDVTLIVSDAQEEVTEAEESAEEPEETLPETPVEEPAEEPEEPTEELDEEPTEEPAEEPTPGPTEEPETYEEEVTPNPEPVWDPSEEEDEQEEDDEEPIEEEDEDEELFEFDDDDMGSVSDELLEQFNNPDTYEHFEFSGTADIELKQDSFAFGDTVTLVAKVRDVNMSYRLVWEATDDDERGWYTIGSGSEYSFVVTPENINRGYRVVLFTVD